MSEAKRTKIITFRVTEGEYAKIEDAAIAQGKDPNDWCRHTTVQCSSLLLTISERMIYKEIAMLHWLFAHGFQLLFDEDSAELSAWVELVKEAELGANEIVTSLLAKRKLGSR